MKRPLIVLAVCAFVALTGCSSSQKQVPAVPEAGNDTKDGLKIAIVTSPTGVDDGSFNQNNFEGVQAFLNTHPDSGVTPVNEPTGDNAASVQAVADIVADYDVIITPGFQFSGIGQLAADNPDVRFILVDSYPTDADGMETELDNVYAMQFAEQEGGFFAGVAAALETKTGKTAVVNGVAFPSNVNYQYGFEAGVNYAVKNLGARAECVEIPAYAGTDVANQNIGGNYTGSFSDQAQGKVIGQALIAQGADVIFVAAGGAGNGVFTAAKEAQNVKVIGCDVDQYDDGVNGDQNIILTSALKIMDKNVEKQLNAIADGTFHGGNYLLKADSDSTGYVFEKGRQQLSDHTIPTLEQVYAQVRDGTIVPPSYGGNTAPDDFPGLDPAGQ